MKIKVPKDVITIAKILRDNGHSCYLVGGAVRDQLLGLKAKDHDLCSDAKPEEIIKLFNKVIPTGIKHGTVTILIKKIPYEITTFRVDGQYTDGRRPDQISFTSDLLEDLKRRDFTINAIAFDILKNKIIDPNNGIEDISNRIIRAIGVPEERFNEDGLRSIRACRFASQLEFCIEPSTLLGIKNCLNKIPDLSKERIYDELIKIFLTSKPSISFELFRKTGILPIILPELSSCIGVDQKGNHSYDVYTHLLKSCDAAPRDNEIVRIAALFHDIGKPESKGTDDKGTPTFHNHEMYSSRTADKIMQRYRFPKEKSRRIIHLIENHMFHYTDEWTDSAVRRFIRRVGIESLDNIYKLREADISGMSEGKESYTNLIQLKSRVMKILEQENAFSIKDLAINGNDLMNILKVPGGPHIGMILEFLLESVLEDPNQNKKDVLLKIAESYYNQIR